MSRSRSSPPSSDKPATARVALDALLESEAGSPGGELLRRALWLETLDLQLRPCLPPALAAHARLANIDGHRLVYLVDAAVWHARLRLAATDLLDTARSLGLGVTELTIRISSLPSMREAGDARPTTPVTPLSAAAREAIATALAPDDEPSPRKDSS